MIKLQMVLGFLLVSSQVLGLCENSSPAISLGSINYPGLTENSGMDFSRQHQGVFWTHNDANNDARIFAISSDGTNLAEFKIANAANEDWEDISVASCLHNPSIDCIYIADVGNNKGERSEFSIYVIEEPLSLVSKNLTAAKKISFSPVGKLNFESFAVNDNNYDFYFISKKNKKDRELLSTEKASSTLFKLAKHGSALQEIARLDFKSIKANLIQG